eukprot:2921614-Alexandrium_andersonii.AAC.1
MRQRLTLPPGGGAFFIFAVFQSFLARTRSAFLFLAGPARLLLRRGLHLLRRRGPAARHPVARFGTGRETKRRREDFGHGSQPHSAGGNVRAPWQRKSPSPPPSARGGVVLP